MPRHRTLTSLSERRRRRNSRRHSNIDENTNSVNNTQNEVVNLIDTFKCARNVIPKAFYSYDCGLMDLECKFCNAKHFESEVTLDNFDPETSARERRKLNRKSYFNNTKSKPKPIYNERGLIAATGKDLCDCLDDTCPGCHFPCPKCNSNKCALECRVNRKWMYDKIEVEGNDFVVKNNYKK